MSARSVIESLLSLADVKVGGERPWDIKINDQRVFARVFRDGSLGFGESYMNGWWDASAIDQLMDHIFRAELDRKVRANWRLALAALTARAMNLQSPRRAFQIGEAHYDLGNDLYEAMLDARMIYSCGYWRDAKTLDEAQEAKLDLICQKLQLAPGLILLDIGCGWGGLAKFAAEKYGVRVVGITVSKEQAALARERCKNLPIEIRLQDYRQLNPTQPSLKIRGGEEGLFDRIVSVGMFEHVGYKNYRTFMEVARRCLKNNGLFLLHTIGGNRSVTQTDPWIAKYIFPNSMLPSVKQISAASEGVFVMEDWHSFGPDYDKTLMAWFANFDRAWPTLKAKYGDRFYRMWKFYLLSCAGSFRARKNQLWQIVFSKNGVPDGYQSIR